MFLLKIKKHQLYPLLDIDNPLPSYQPPINPTKGNKTLGKLGYFLKLLQKTSWPPPKTRINLPYLPLSNPTSGNKIKTNIGLFLKSACSYLGIAGIQVSSILPPSHPVQPNVAHSLTQPQSKNRKQEPKLGSFNKIFLKIFKKISCLLLRCKLGRFYITCFPYGVFSATVIRESWLANPTKPLQHGQFVIYQSYTTYQSLNWDIRYSSTVISLCDQYWTVAVIWRGQYRASPR